MMPSEVKPNLVYIELNYPQLDELMLSLIALPVRKLIRFESYVHIFQHCKLPYQMKFVVLLPFRCIVSIVAVPPPSLSLSVNLFGHCSRPWPKKAPFKPFVVVPINVAEAVVVVAVVVVVSGLFTAQHKSAPKTWRCLQP